MQKNTFDIKVALITGAARRIGAEIARALHQAGINVVLHYNASESQAASLSKELNEMRAHSAIAIGADLQDSENSKILVQKTKQAFGRLDVLVNNASRYYRTAVGSVTDFAWEDLMNSNLKAPFFLSQAAAPMLAESKGCIINITDIHAEYALTDYSVYCLSKSGLNMMTKVFAKELGPNVRVNAIAPGVIMWPEGENTLHDTEKNQIIDHTLLKRVGDPSDIAKAVLFFVNDAGYITGQVIAIDGGRYFYS
jgi:pteridine reductase